MLIWLEIAYWEHLEKVCFTVCKRILERTDSRLFEPPFPKESRKSWKSNFLIKVEKFFYLFFSFLQLKLSNRSSYWGCIFLYWVWFSIFLAKSSINLLQDIPQRRTFNEVRLIAKYFFQHDKARLKLYFIRFSNQKNKISKCSLIPRLILIILSSSVSELFINKFLCSFL